MSSKALVVLSGGQDSTTCAFWSKKNFHEIHAITFDYGQKHAIEINAALTVGKLAGVKSHALVKVGPLAGRSPLTNQNEKLERYESYEQMDRVIGERVELTFVPGRNTIFLSYALNYAVGNDIWDIITGVCQADGSNYPDCTPIYVSSLEAAFNASLGMMQKLQIHTPLMNLKKSETVKLAMELPGCYEALAWSHTSYDGTFPPTDRNHSNVLRAQGFLEADRPDPLVVRAYHEGLMELPDTPNYDWLRMGDRRHWKLDELLQESKNVQVVSSGKVTLPAASFFNRKDVDVRTDN